MSLPKWISSSHKNLNFSLSKTVFYDKWDNAMPPERLRAHLFYLLNLKPIHLVCAIKKKKIHLISFVPPIILVESFTLPIWQIRKPDLDWLNELPIQYNRDLLNTCSVPGALRDRKRTKAPVGLPSCWHSAGRSIACTVQSQGCWLRAFPRRALRVLEAVSMFMQEVRLRAAHSPCKWESRWLTREASDLQA